MQIEFNEVLFAYEDCCSTWLEEMWNSSCRFERSDAIPRTTKTDLIIETNRIDSWWSWRSENNTGKMHHTRRTQPYWFDSGLGPHIYSGSMVTWTSRSGLTKGNIIIIDSIESDSARLDSLSDRYQIKARVRRRFTNTNIKLAGEDCYIIIIGSIESGNHPLLINKWRWRNQRKTLVRHPFTDSNIELTNGHD